MFNPILVPLDGSLLAECVLQHSIAIAQAFDAKIILLRVLEKNHPNGSTQVFDLINWQIKKTEAKLYLEKVRTRLIKIPVADRGKRPGRFGCPVDHRICSKPRGEINHSEQSWTQRCISMGDQQHRAKNHPERALLAAHRSGASIGGASRRIN